MSGKKIVRAEMAKIGTIWAKHGLKPADPFALYCDLADHFLPETLRTARDLMEAALAKINETLETKEPGAEVKAEDMMRPVGLDPNNRSDRARVLQHLRNSSLVQITKAKPEQMVRALTNGRAKPETEPPV
jgi:hypothetical protein